MIFYFQKLDDMFFIIPDQARPMHVIYFTTQ